MSGLKYSEINLETERRACQEAIISINGLISSISALREKAKAILDEIPEGVKGSFPQEIEKVMEWQKRNLPSASWEMNSTELNMVVKRLEAANQDGKELLCLLIEIKEVRREAKARALMGKLEILKSELTGMEGLLKKWESGLTGKFMSELNGLYPGIEAGELVKTEKRLGELTKGLTQLGQKVIQLQEQDDQRRYVFEALKGVCQEMGWSPEGEPHLEDKEKPDSPILYEVETYSAGKMTFRLTLEGIKVDSPFSREEKACFREFDNFSERLKKLGVLTNFRPLNIQGDEPVLPQEDKRDPPGEGREEEEMVKKF